MHTSPSQRALSLAALVLFVCATSGAFADPLVLDEAGPTPKVTTPGGCVVAPEGKDAAWTISAPAGVVRVALVGKSVQVTESGGASWRVPGSMSFILPDGTKVTLGMKMDRQNGLVPENLHIAHGDDDVIISGLFKNKLKSTASQSRADNDARFADGDYAILDAQGAFFLLAAAQVADLKAGKPTPALRITGTSDGPFDTKPAAGSLAVPAAALPLLVVPDPE